MEHTYTLNTAKTLKVLDRLQQDLRDLIEALSTEKQAPEAAPVDLTVYAVPQTCPGETAKPAATLEEVRKVLVTKAREGKNDAVRELLGHFHAVSLPEVDPADYADLLEMGRKL